MVTVLHWYLMLDKCCWLPAAATVMYMLQSAFVKDEPHLIKIMRSDCQWPSQADIASIP